MSLRNSTGKRCSIADHSNQLSSRSQISKSCEITAARFSRSAWLSAFGSSASAAIEALAAATSCGPSIGSLGLPYSWQELNSIPNAGTLAGRFLRDLRDPPWVAPACCRHAPNPARRALSVCGDLGAGALASVSARLGNPVDQARCIQEGGHLIKRLLNVERDLDCLVIEARTRAGVGSARNANSRSCSSTLSAQPLCRLSSIPKICARSSTSITAAVLRRSTRPAGSSQSTSAMACLRISAIRKRTRTIPNMRYVPASP